MRMVPEVSIVVRPLDSICRLLFPRSVAVMPLSRSVPPLVSRKALPLDLIARVEALIEVAAPEARAELRSALSSRPLLGWWS